MFNKNTKKDYLKELEGEIEVVKNRLEEFSPEDDEYEKVLSKYETLVRLYTDLAQQNKSVLSKISPDTMAIVVGNLIGIGLILGYEKTNIITSKALGFVLKGRV